MAESRCEARTGPKEAGSRNSSLEMDGRVVHIGLWNKRGWDNDITYLESAASCMSRWADGVGRTVMGP